MRVCPFLNCNNLRSPCSDSPELAEVLSKYCEDPAHRNCGELRSSLLAGYSQVFLVPQPEHSDAAAPKSTPQLSVKPISVKSTLTGWTFSKNSLFTIYLKPSISKTWSPSLDSSRAIASEGPPHPPAFRKIRIGATSLSLKYSAICFEADAVTSTIMFSFSKKLYNIRNSN